MAIGEKQILARKGYQTQKGNWRYTRSAIGYLEEGIERFLGTRSPGFFKCSIAESQHIFVSN